MSASAPAHVDADLLRDLAEAAFAVCGVDPEDSRIAAVSLVESDLRGVRSHGIARLPWYVRRLRAGGDNPRPNIRVVADGPSSAALDGDAGLGQVVAHRAMNLAIEKAASSGVGVVTVRNSHHFGACAYWAEMALSHGMIGIAISNGGPNMAPWGGITPTTGNDPIGVAIPTGRDPIIVDMALSVVAGGRLDVAGRAGEPIPLGWALDAQGEPTTDPISGRRGSLLPIGDHKGYGLAVVFEVLAAVLSGAMVGREVPWPADDSQAMGVGHYFQAIRIDGFMPPARFRGRADHLVEQIRSAGVRSGFDRIRLPGEIEAEESARRVKEGIPMPVSELEPLIAMAVDLELGPHADLLAAAKPLDGSATIRTRDTREAQ